jgi:tetratricopeptide (TPR) repeat protein
VAKYKKKRARELQHDKFRDTAISIFDRLGDRLAGKGRTILYGLIGVVVLAALIAFYVQWSQRKSDEARRAIGRAITISRTQITGELPPGAPPPTGPTFSNERERAQRAIEEFEKVAAKYGDPYGSESRYFIATNRLLVEREKGINELAALTNNGLPEVATLSKFALAQAKEADGQLDEAAKLYSDIAALNSSIVTPDTANLRLAEVYQKQGKTKEAADLLFNIVEASRIAKDPDGNSAKPSAASREAAQNLEKVDPERYAKLTPEAPVAGNLPF